MPKKRSVLVAITQHARNLFRYEASIRRRSCDAVRRRPKEYMMAELLRQPLRSCQGRSIGQDRVQTQGQWLQQSDSSTRSAQSSAVFSANASEPRQKPDTRSHRACVRSAAERAGRSDRANDRHRAGARQDRLAEPGLQHSPPGDAGTARRGMKMVVVCSVPTEGGRPEDNRKQDLTRTCALEHCSRCPEVVALGLAGAS